MEVLEGLYIETVLHVLWITADKYDPYIAVRKAPDPLCRSDPVWLRHFYIQKEDMERSRPYIVRQQQPAVMVCGNLEINIETRADFLQMVFQKKDVVLFIITDGNFKNQWNILPSSR